MKLLRTVSISSCLSIPASFGKSTFFCYIQCFIPYTFNLGVPSKHLESHKENCRFLCEDSFGFNFPLCCYWSFEVVKLSRRFLTFSLVLMGSYLPIYLTGSRLFLVKLFEYCLTYIIIENKLALYIFLNTSNKPCLVQHYHALLISRISYIFDSIAEMLLSIGRSSSLRIYTKLLMPLQVRCIHSLAALIR